MAVATSSLQRCAFLDPDFAPAKFLLGLCLRRQEKPAAAADVFLASASCAYGTELRDHLLMTGVSLAEHGAHWRAVDCFYRVMKAGISSAALARGRY